MKARQFVTPVLVRNGAATVLRHIPFDDRTFKEADLQALLFAHPKLIPVRDIEPIFDGLLPLARELRVGSGFIDLVFMNDEGYLTLVETKLWRNPEARRTVVAQLVDYASHLSDWTYDELRQAVLDSRKGDDRASGDPLFELVDEGDGEVNEREFIDRVNRNLRLGRFVLLIVGDGIREGVEQMADFLNQTPQLQFTLGLVEMGLYALDPKAEPPEFYVQPRIVARTREVTRAVVEIKTTVQPDEVRVSVPTTEPEAQNGPVIITERAFLEKLSASSSPEVVRFAEWVIEHAPEQGLTIAWGGAGPMVKYIDAETGHFFTFGQLHWSGILAQTGRLSERCLKLGLDRSIYRRYLDQVTALMPGTVRYEYRRKPSDRGSEGICIGEKPGPLLMTKVVWKDERLDPLVTRGPEWFAIIDATVQQIREALEDRDDSH